MFAKFRAKVLKIAPISEEECNRYFLEKKIPTTLPAKDFFLKEGEVNTKMAFVQKGVLRMFYISEDGKETNVQFFFEDDFVASYQSFITQTQSKYFIQALEDCELITISYNALQNAYSNSIVWQKFGRIIAEKVFTLSEQRTESLLFQNAEERYLSLLKKRPIIFEKIPLYHIASFLGIERESLSRLRKKIAKSGL